MAEKPKVYFTKVISPEKLIELYNKLDSKLQETQPERILLSPVLQ